MKTIPLTDTDPTKTPSLLARIAAELGVHSIWYSCWDTKLLCFQRFIRLFAYGASTLILALFLSSIGSSDAQIGLFMTLTLLGDVAISFCLTLVADGLGRRRILALGAALMSASGVVFVLSDNYWVLVVASIFGVISPRYCPITCEDEENPVDSRRNSGNEIGPFRAIEESTLAQLTPSNIRSDIFAWYTLLGIAGAAFGTIVCGWLVQYMIAPGRMDEIAAYRVIFGVYAALGLAKLVISLMMSDKCEPEPPKQEYQPMVNVDAASEAEGLMSDSEDEEEDEPDDDSDGIQKPSKQAQAPLQPQPQQSRSPLPELKPKSKSLIPHLSAHSRVTVIKLCLLFAIDSFASGLVPASWLTYFFNRKFALPEGSLGTLFFVTNIISAISNLAASSLAKRIGLVKTMVFTHLPSAIFLALIPLPNVVWLAMALLVLRSSMSSMDQAPRQAFLSAAVLPSERTAVMGVVNVVKTLSQSGGPVATGWLAGIDKFWIAFLVAGGLKATYDLALLKMFLGYKSREDIEEQERQEQQQQQEMREVGSEEQA